MDQEEKEKETCGSHLKKKDEKQTKGSITKKIGRGVENEI